MSLQNFWSMAFRWHLPISNLLRAPPNGKNPLRSCLLGKKPHIEIAWLATPMLEPLHQDVLKVQKQNSRSTSERYSTTSYRRI